MPPAIARITDEDYSAIKERVISDAEAKKVADEILEGFKSRPDIVDLTPGLPIDFYEIKTVGGALLGVADLNFYQPLLQVYYAPRLVQPGPWIPQQSTYVLETTYGLPFTVTIEAWNQAPGLIVYRSPELENLEYYAVLATELGIVVARRVFVPALAGTAAGEKTVRAGGLDTAIAMLLALMGAG